MARFQSGGEIRDVALGDDRRAYCDDQRALLAAGWTRVCDPACEEKFPDHPQDERLEAAIRENPDDDQAWLVYADLLIERGHPRGPLVALESAPVKNIVQRAEREAESRRLRNATAEHFGRGLVGRGGLSVRWRRGFIHSARIHGAFARGAAEDLLFDLLRHPCGRFLRELELTCWHHDAQDHRLLVDLLAHAAPAPPLRRLVIEYATDAWTGFPPLGDVGALSHAYPALEILQLEGDDTTRFAGLSLPRAKRFRFETSRMPSHVPRALAAAPWPALEELELWFRDSTCTVDDVRFVLALPRLARLRVLAAPWANELALAIVSSPIAAHLAMLDLRYGGFDDRGATALVAARGAFPAAFELRVDCTRLSPDVRGALEDVVDVNVGRW
jgi:uncharacterized protein (TIGR02996 family)